MLGDLKQILAEKNLRLEWDDAAVNALVEKGYSDKYGARNLRRLIQTEIEDPLAARMIENYESPLKAASISADSNGLTITVI